MLGVKYLVVHPIFKIDDEIIQDRDTFISVNAEAIRRWLPLAQERNVVLLSENILWGASADPNYCVLKFTATDGRFYGDYYPRSFVIE